MKPKSYVFICTPLGYREGLRDLAEKAIQPKAIPIGTVVYIRNFDNLTMWWKLEKASIGDPPKSSAAVIMSSIDDDEMDEIMEKSELINFEKLITTALSGWLIEGLSGLPLIDGR